MAKLEKGEPIAEQRTTLANVFTLYEQHRTPKKSAQHQKEDRRRIELWARVLGGAIDPHNITREKWEAFLDARSSGAMDARGNLVPENDRKKVRARGVEIDCRWLRAVFNWAVTWTVNGRYLMRENPLRGYALPKEKNVRRPVATQDRFDAVRAKSDQHTYFVGGRGTRIRQRSYLSELLDIVNGTGRRISAICALRFDDLRLERTKVAPFGAIRWPADTDKTGRETIVPISATVRAAIDRILKERPGVGRVPLFPAPEDPERPMTRHLANKWLREGEKLADLKPLKGGLWHPYRRKWATERKALPDVDVAASGGWKSTATLKLYQQVDAATMLHVVLGGAELREAK
ncbi:MAG TPA: tyrosine-type recombinase/integrase [Gemmatimonadaceae bacterium]